MLRSPKIRRGRGAGALAAAVLLSGLLPLLGCESATTREERGHELYGYCQQCHGTDGAGNEDYRAPSIAGLPPWYVRAQLDKFRTGARGDHPEDVDGLRMRPMSRTLANQNEIAMVSEYVASLRPPELPNTVEGDVDHGRELYEPCVQCHKEQAQGDPSVGAPPLTGQSDWYLVAQLQKFKDGIRGSDPQDTPGSQMAPMVTGLADEQAMRDVVAYIRTLGR